jgi:DNA-binding NtrC family response regulator
MVGPFPDWTEIADQARERGWDVRLVESGAEAFRCLGEDDGIFVVLLPNELRDGPADNLLRRARGGGTRADFVVLASGSGREQRASLLAEGADEILAEPIGRGRVLAKLDRLRDRRLLIDDLGLVVRDPVMLELFERILRVAPLKVTTLITGESGTGKEMLASAIHRASDRRDGPFIPVNVGALPESLLESELFGHEKGAFTSADSMRIGRFELADRGTLFLDEIAEMSLPSQVNLLRVLEEERFLRVGGQTSISVDVRIVAATNRDLESTVREGKFRRDLYYRLKVVHLEVPPLRQRTQEIPLLVRTMAARASARHGVSFPGFDRDAMEVLTKYEWPGNVRELKNLVDGLVALRPETSIRTSDLPSYVLQGGAPERPLPALPTDRREVEREFILQSLLALRAEVAAIREMLAFGSSTRPEGAGPSEPRGGYAGMGVPVAPAGPVRVEEDEPAGTLSMKDLERRTVERALRESGGNRRLAARALGISERTLYRRIKEYGLGEPESSRSGD